MPEVFNVMAKSDGCYIKLSWKTPSANGCPITHYTVHYREAMSSSSNKREWQTEFVLDTKKGDYSLQLNQLNCSTKYEVIVVAWNQLGGSHADGKLVYVQTEKGTTLKR